MAYDVALVSLETAVLYARRGRTDQVKTLARHMTPIFQDAIHREAIAALALFWPAADAEISGSRTAQKDIQSALELLLAGRMNDPADFQTIASLTVSTR